MARTRGGGCMRTRLDGRRLQRWGAISREGALGPLGPLAGRHAVPYGTVVGRRPARKEEYVAARSVRQNCQTKAYIARLRFRSRLDRLDQKSTLQELLASLGRPSPLYTVTAQGPDHDKEFTATVVIDGDVLGTGVGRSKKLAEQQAAGEAIDTLNASDHP